MSIRKLYVHPIDLLRPRGTMIESGIGRLYIAIRMMRGMGNFGKYVILAVDLVRSYYPGSLLS